MAEIFYDAVTTFTCGADLDNIVEGLTNHEM